MCCCLHCDYATFLNDVTESTVTIRSPFCGYNMTYCVELMSEDSPFKGNLVSWFKKMSTYHQPTNKGYLSDIRVKLSFTHKMAAKTSWHRYGMKLHHCHPMYCSTCSSEIRFNTSLLVKYTVWLSILAFSAFTSHAVFDAFCIFDRPAFFSLTFSVPHRGFEAEARDQDEASGCLRVALRLRHP